MADSIKIRITGDDSDFSKTLSGVGQKAGSVFKGMMASQIVTRGISLLTRGLRGAIDTGMQFEAAMSQVAAISGATGRELELLTETAKRYGETTMFSASQAAEALNYMALAGWDAQQSVDALGGVLDLAAASGMDLGAASDAVTDYLSAFSMEASQAGYMADLMAYAQSNANTSAAQLADAYGNCASSMHAAGQDIETTTAMLMALANQGIKGSEAGTQMAAVMRDLTQKMEGGRIMIGKTAVQAVDAQGNFRDLGDILADVGRATEGMGTAEQSAALMETFTARSVKAIQTILNEGVGSVNAYEEALRGSAGTAAEQAETMMDNLQGDVKIFQSALEGLQITASESTNGIARSLVQEATGILDAVNRAGKAGGLGGMADALIAQVPSLLPKLTKGVQGLLGGLGKRLPGLVKGLLATLPDLLGNMGELVPSLIESLTETAGSAIEGVIGNLPQIATSFAVGLGKSMLAAMRGAVNLGGSLIDTLLSVKGAREYESYGKLVGELNYSVGTTATVDNGGARKDVEAARKAFIEELQGYGLSNEDIVTILGFTGTEAELQALLEASYPDLSDVQRNAIVARLTGESGEAMRSAVADLEGYGLTPDQIVEILAFDGTEGELEEKLKQSLPDLKAVQIHALQAKLTGSQDADTADLVTEATDMGLTVEQIARLLAFTGTEEEVKQAIKDLLPDLSDAQRDALFEHFSETDFTASLSQLSEELGDMGLTAEQIAQLLVVQAEGGDLEGAIKDLLPDLDAAAQAAVYSKLNENGGIAANLSGELAGLGIKPEDIAKLLTYQGEGDTASIESLLEKEYADIKQQAITALQNAWNNSEATFTSGVGGSSMGYMAQLLTDMFTDGVKDDDASVEAMLANAKAVIDTARQKIYDYLANGGEDTEGAQNALNQLNELDSAFTEYAIGYANASKAVCEEQGAVLRQMAQQCQDAVDSITASTQQLLSIQEILFNQGKSGARLSDEDLASAMLFISTKYQQALADAQEAKEAALQAGADYDEAERIYQNAVANALTQSTRDVADLIRGQMGDVAGLDVGAALSGVADQIRQSIQDHGGTAIQSEVEQILRDAGYGDDIIGQAIEAIFGEQQYDGTVNIGAFEGHDFGDDLNQQLADYIALNGNVDAGMIAGLLRGSGYGEDIVGQVLSELFTRSDMTTDSLNLDAIIGGFDFGNLGRVVVTAIENGLMENPEGLDVNQLILQMIGDSLEGGEVDLSTGGEAAGESLPEGLATGIEEAAGQATDAAGALGEDTIAALDEAVAHHSPSAKAQEAGASIPEGLAVGMAEGEGQAVAAAGELGDAVIDKIKTKTNDADSAGRQFSAGVAAGILSGRSQVIAAAIEVARAAVAALKGELQIASPSRITEGFGRMFDQGLAVGIDREAAAVVRSAVDLSNRVIGAANLTPKLDLSGLSASMRGAVSDIADIESSRDVVLQVRGRELARTTERDYNAALNGYNRRVKLGYGRG